MKATIAVPPVGRIAVTQATVLIIAAIAMAPVSMVAAYSILIGGVIQVVPQAYFTHLAFRYQGARQVSNTLRAIYQGASGKMLLTTVMFALAFSFIKPLSVPSLFVSYCAMVVMQWHCTSRLLSN